MIGYIYLHKSPSGKCYVGQTTMNPPDKRWRYADAYKQNSYFSAAITKYGWDNFEHIILEQVHAKDKISLIKQLNVLEEAYIEQLCTMSPKGYNLRAGGSNTAMSAESCEKMRKAAIGNTRRKGTKTSEQGLSNIRAGSLKRAPLSEETKLKIGIGNRGKTVSAESRKKISEARKGIQFSETHRKNLSLAQKGKQKPSSQYVHTKEQATKAWETRRLNGTDIASNKGKVCITDGISNRYIMANDILPEGWHYGSSQPNRIKKFEKTWLNDGQYAYFITNDEVDKYLTLGYKRGKNGFKKKPD